MRSVRDESEITEEQLLVLSEGSNDTKLPDTSVGPKRFY
jgi:hypothetical protein